MNIIKEMKTDHIRRIRIIEALPTSQTSYAQSPMQMIHPLVPDVPRDRLEDLQRQMTELGIFDITDWSAAVPGGPEQVRKSMTETGQRLKKFSPATRRQLEPQSVLSA